MFRRLGLLGQCRVCWPVTTKAGISELVDSFDERVVQGSVVVNTFDTDSLGKEVLSVL